MPDRPPGMIAIAASFTAEPLLPSLPFVLRQAGMALDVSFAPYNQVFQELLSPSSLFARNTNGVDVILIRIEDFIRDVVDVDTALKTLARTVEELSSALSSHAQRAKVPTIVAVFAPSPKASATFLTELTLANARVSSLARSLPGVALLTAEEIDLVSNGDPYDTISDELAHVPFTQPYYASLALAIARKAHALLVPAHKVLVLDCDNTLWRGVVGEDGIHGIAITPAFEILHRFAIKVHSQGALLCLLSKNAEADVLEVFEKRSDMLLKADHIVAHRIDWNTKPQNIAELARSLNLGLDSFVFLDDNPVECALMRAEHPEVLTLQIPQEHEIEGFLAHLWAFDKVSVTDEDRRRTQMYKEHAARLQLEDSVTDIGDFIASLQVEIDIKRPDEKDWPRLAQLTQRTNQFNFTTIRRTETELRALADEGSAVLRINVRDRFGDYGLVGLAIASPEPDRLRVDTLLLSCRVLGRGVEHAILRYIGDAATEDKLGAVEVPYRPTRKNEPARAFIESVAANYRSDENGEVRYLIPSSVARAITHRPGSDPAAVIEASKSTERDSSRAKTIGASVNRSENYAALAQTLTTGRDVEIALSALTARARSLPGEAAIASNETEQKMLTLWQDVLGIHGLGIDDDFLATGGSSLLAARLFAEIVRQFGTKLPLTTILNAPTVRTLSRHVGNPATSSGSLVELKSGSPRNLFLIHDGDGETLLYANLASRLPKDFAVVGIEPRRLENVPLAHASIADMAGFYLKSMRERQPVGPYLLGGMCAGGVIAYEMAKQLIDAGESVELVALLDAAAPQASKRPGRITKQRLDRFSELLKARSEVSLLKRLRVIADGIFVKIWSAAKWELLNFFERFSVRARFGFLKALLRRQATWPTIIPGLSVRQIYECAEASYVPQLLPKAPIILIRAKSGTGGDTPYQEIYTDETLGWGSVAASLTIADVEGGHFSMLQEPFVTSLADTLGSFLGDRSSVNQVRAEVGEPA